MNDRFMFRLPFYNNDGTFSHFEFILIGESLPAYNAGVMFHRGEYEQCTGLKDNCGNLIYEGDVVKAVTNTYKVIWDRYRWAIKDSQGYIFSEYINDLLYDCEITGNIHEQPEQKDK